MSKVAKTTVILMGLTIFSKIIGLIRESVMAATYGTTMYKAVYDISNNIPVVIFAIIATAIATSYIPVYNKVYIHDGRDGALRFTNSIINIVITLCIILSILGIIFIRPIVRVFALGYTGESFELAVNFTRILLPTIITVGVANILTSFLQVNDNFHIPALIGLPYNIIIITSILLSKHTSIYVLIIGTFIAITSKMVFMIPSSIKKGLRYKPRLNLRDEAIREVVVLVLPVLIGVGVQQINSTVDKSLATTLGYNIVSSFGYSLKLYEFVQAIFIVNILSIVYPRLAQFTANDKMNEFKKSLKKTMNVVTVILLPIVVGAAVLSIPVVRILYQRQSFTPEDTIITANIMSIYVIGLLAFSLRDIITRGFYSLHDSKTPMINSVIAVVCNIVLNLLLIKPLGYKGLAIATTVSAFIGLILFIISIRKKIGDFGVRSFAKVGLSAAISAGVMGVVVFFSFRLSSQALGISIFADLIGLIASVIVGAIVYAAMLYLLRVEELFEIMDMIKKIGNSKVFTKVKRKISR